MKVLHIIAGELTEGAARGAYWLHQGLRELGVNSIVFTNSRQILGDTFVTTSSKTKKDKVFNLLRVQMDTLPCLLYPKTMPVLFSTGYAGVNFIKTEEYSKADVVHLHWINLGFINIRHLRKVKKPIVWTMRDMWPMTGGCHYSLNCNNYVFGCGKCPHLGSRRKNDLSRLVLKRKQRYIPKNMKLVGVSCWLSELAKESALFKDFDVRTIHNNVNTENFFPLKKYVARQALGLPFDKPIVLTGAQHLNQYYKGFDIFLEATSKINLNPLLLFFGNLNPTHINHLKHDYVHLGFLHDMVALRLAYSAADVFVSSSRMDAFPKTLAESMACGTPVVCFDATGPRDIVNHLKTGYKAEPFDPLDLAKGIDWVLNHPDPAQLSKAAREKVVRDFDSKVVASKYIRLYEEMLAHK